MTHAFDPTTAQAAERTPQELIADARAAMLAVAQHVATLVPDALGIIVALESQVSGGEPSRSQLGSLAVFLPPQTDDHPGGQIVYAPMVGTQFDDAMGSILGRVEAMRQQPEHNGDAK